MNRDQLEEVKKLRGKYPQLDLQSAKNAVEDGYFILYCHPEGGKFWSSQEAYNWFPLFGREMKWEMVPYQKGIEILEIIRYLQNFNWWDGNSMEKAKRTLAKYVRHQYAYHPRIKSEDKAMIIREVLFSR
jgi:hypothetical protein